MSFHTRISNLVGRSLSTILPGFGTGATTMLKRVHAREFGWPELVSFADALYMYRRHPLARAAVDKTVTKTWETLPTLRTSPEGSDLTPGEKAIAEYLRRIRFWQQFAEADRRSIVGAYSGLILRIGDGRAFDKPVAPSVGIRQLVEVIPAWQHQLQVLRRDQDVNSPDYGRPQMWVFNEDDGGLVGVSRRVNVHPDRVLILSRDGTVNDRSQLEAGFNSLIDTEKVSGAGAEGFFKNSKGTPVLSLMEESTIEDLADSLGVALPDVADKIGEVVEGWLRSHDSALLIDHMKAEFPNIRMPDPENFWEISARMFAASMQIPLHILTGMQIGDRASNEDALEWARTCQSRRENEILPALMSVIERLETIGVLDSGSWWLDWPRLDEDSEDDKLDRANKMATTNKNASDNVYSVGEMRKASGYREEDAPPPLDEEEVEDAEILSEEIE